MKLLDKAAYTTGILFYFSLFAGVILFITALSDSVMSDPMKNIEDAAESILETPDLSAGLEALEYAVEQDLQDLENMYKG